MICSLLSVDEGAEWREFDSSNRADMRRASTLSRSQSIFTTFTSHDKDRSLAHANALLRNSVDRKIDAISSIMSEFASKLHISDKSVQKGIEMLLKIISHQITRGYSKESIAASILYIVCTLDGYPRTISEISKVSLVERKRIGHLSTLILQQLGIQKGIIQPDKLIHRFASLLKLPFLTAEFAREMCILIGENELVESSCAPQVIAAASIILVCGMTGDALSIPDLERITSSSATSVMKLKGSLERYLRVITPLKLKASLSKKRERQGNESDEKEHPLKVTTTNPSCA